MKRNKFRGLWYIPVMTFVVSLSACLGSGDETIVLEEGKPAHGIPSDDDGKVISSVPDRSKMYQGQTPQTYIRIKEGWRNCEFKYDGWIKK